MPPSRPNVSIPVWAESGDRIQPEAYEIGEGFPHTNDKPTRQAMNWVLNYAMNGVQYLTTHSIADWDGITNYLAGDVVRYQGKFYSAAYNHYGEVPGTDGAWQMWYVLAGDLNASYVDRGTFNSSIQSLSNRIDNIVPGTGDGGPADWNTLLNKPPYISWNTGSWLTNITSGLAVDGSISTYDSVQVYSNNRQHRLVINFTGSGVNPMIDSDSHTIEALRINMQGAPDINFQRLNEPAAKFMLAVGNNRCIEIVHPEIATVHIGAQLHNGNNRKGYLWCNYPFLFETSVEVWGDNLALVGNHFRAFNPTTTLYLDIDVTGSHPRIASTTGVVLATGQWNIDNIAAGDFRMHGPGGYLEFCNNGQFGNNDPWMYSSTDRIRCYVHFWSAKSLSTDGNITGNWLTVNAVQCNGNMTVTGSLNVAGSLNATVNMSGLGELRFDSGVVYARGYKCRMGLGGPFAGNDYNWWWDGAHVHAHIDYTNLGWIQLQTTSDYRLKDGIAPLTDALPLVMRLRPVTYKWRDIPDNGFRCDGVVHAGLLAHEVQEVFPCAIIGARDAVMADGKIEPQHVNEFDLIALLTKAVQELSTRLTILEDQHGIAN